VFTEKELAYLRSQPLGRLATVSPDGQPDNAAVGYTVEGDGSIVIGGMDIARSRKGRNVAAGNERVAFIVDDLESVRPWRPRGIRIYGTARLVQEDGPIGGSYLRVTPEVSWSWDIEGPSMTDEGWRPHRTEHERPGSLG
jgi:pyridoxamine 5'-phosphate oxidase family protein